MIDNAMQELTDRRIEEIKAEKNKLRKTIFSLRKEEPRERLDQLSDRIRLRIEHLSLWKDSRFPFIYISSKTGEVDTHRLIEDALASGKRVCVPVMEKGSSILKVVEISSLDNLITGQYGILEPPPGSHRYLCPENWDIAIVPGLAFDRQGSRLGFGKGCYDRALAGKNAPALAPAFGFQVVEPFTTLPHDIPMDLIVTESETIVVNKSVPD